MTTKKGLEEVNKLYNEGWEYCGGNKDTADKNTWKFFKKLLGIDENYKPKHRSSCVCGHHIELQCYIYKYNDKGNIVIKIIGIDCIRQFYNIVYLDYRNKYRKCCPVCCAIHSNTRRTDLCSTCCDLCCLDCYKPTDKKYRLCYECKYKPKKKKKKKKKRY